VQLWPLWRQLMVALVASMILIATCAGMFQYQTETQAMQQLLARQNKKNFQLLQAAIVEPIISEDLPVLDSFVTLLSEQDKDLFSVDIYNVDAKQILSWQRSMQLPEKPLMSYSENIILHGQFFGELRVSWSVDHFFQLIEQKIFHTQLFLVVMLLSMTFMAMVLLLKLIVSPIKVINRRVSHYLTGASGIHLKRNSSSQEFSQLETSVAILGKAYANQVIIENELRETKQEIEALSQRNDLILSSAGEGIFVVDSQALTIYVNPAATEMTGWEAEDLMGKGLKCLFRKAGRQSRTCQDCVNSETVSNDIKNCDVYSSFMNGEVHHVSHEFFLHKDGHSFPVEYVSTPIIENEHMSGAVIIFKDISQRIISEQQLKDSESLKQAMLSSSLDAIITVDQEGLICEFNHAAEHMFIRKKEDVLGEKMVEIIVPPVYQEAHQKGFNNYLLTKQSKVLRQRIEVSAMRSDGEEFPIELVITPITLHEKIFFTAFMSDITERQRAKSDIEEARKQAEKASIAKSQFLAAMSHEIRTPLNAIIGINDLLQTTELSPEQWGYVQIAEQSGFALREIINNILDFSKIEAGKLELELQQTDIVELIDSIVLIMAPKAVEKNLDLVAVINYPIPDTIVMDPVRIKQVLLNLVSNAIKFTENGFVEIHLDVESKKNQGCSIEISIIDSGIGIAKNIQHSLFDEFTQADLTTTRKYGGTGLGLAIASRLVNMSGGRLCVESIEGEGSRFYFRLNVNVETLIQFKPIDVNCWIFDRGTKGEKGAELFNKQLKPLVKSVQTLASWNDMVISEQPSIVFFDEMQLAYFSKEEVEQFKNEKPENCLIVLVVNNLQKQVNKEWLNVFDERLIKPIPIKSLKLFLSNHLYPGETEHKTSVNIDKSNDITAFSGVGFRILLVEDSSVNQLVIKSMLEKEGFYVDVADNGLVATEKVKKETFDLILMDLSMPVMGGVEATKIIRKGSVLNQRVPIIALTANAFKENRQQCYQAGMNGFLAKPITMAHLSEEIEKHLSTSSKTRNDNSQNQTKADGCNIIDASVLETLKQETSKEVFPSLLNAFLEHGEKRVKAIEEACKVNDYKGLENEVHTLKSESATFGAITLAELTKRINLLCKQGKEKQAVVEANSIKEHWQDVREELVKYL